MLFPFWKEKGLKWLNLPQSLHVTSRLATGPVPKWWDLGNSYGFKTILGKGMTGIMGYDEILGNFESTYHMILVFLIFPSHRGGSVSVHRCFGQCFFSFPARAQGISDDSRSVALEGITGKQHKNQLEPSNGGVWTYMEGGILVLKMTPSGLRPSVFCSGSLAVYCGHSQRREMTIMRIVMTPRV